MYAQSAALGFRPRGSGPGVPAKGFMDSVQLKEFFDFEETFYTSLQSALQDKVEVSGSNA